MITVVIKRTRDLITLINVSGHADPTLEESQICAAVTAITTGGGNAIDQNINKKAYSIKIGDGKAEFNINLPVFELTVIFETIYWQLKTLQEQYPQHFEWNEFPVIEPL